MTQLGPDPKLPSQILARAKAFRAGKSKGKLPVPPPNHPEASAVNLTAEAIKQEASAIPAFLNRKINGIKDNPPVVSTVAKREADIDAHARQEIVDQQKAAKKTKAQVRAEKKAAAAKGATKAMPLTGKAALQAIAKAAVENGAKVTKVPAGMTASKAGKVAGKPKADGKAPKAAKAQKRTDEPRKGTKLALIVGLLTRKQGCTTADVLKATGWPAVSMPQQAKAAGLKLKKDKDGKVTRYYA